MTKDNEKKILLPKPTWWRKYIDYAKKDLPEIFILKEWKIDNIIKTCKENNIKVVYPVTSCSYSEVYNNLGKLRSNGIFSLTPDPKVNSIIKSKQGFYDWMIENNWKQYIPQVYKDINSHKIDVNMFPCVIKRSNGAGGKATFILNNIGDYQNLVIDKKFNPTKKKHILQEYIPGKIEYATQILSVNGKICYCTTNRYEFNENAKVKTHSGPTDYKTTFDFEIPEGSMKIIKKIIKKLEWTGFCCIDYRFIDNDINNVNNLRIFEINNRIGSNLMANKEKLVHVVNTYCDICEYYLDKIDG